MTRPGVLRCRAHIGSVRPNNVAFGEDFRMPTNRKRLVVPTIMGAGGFEVLKTRDDVEVIPFAPTISSPDFNTLLRADGEVNGAILGLTRFGESEARSAKGLQVVSRIGVGYDTVDVPALTRHKVPLINRKSVVEGKR